MFWLLYCTEAHYSERARKLTNQTTEHPDRSPFDGLTEQQLVEAARDDARVIAYLYRLHYASIYGYVFRRIGNTHDTNDIVADVFVSMVRSIHQFRWTGAPFRCWLLRIATNQINRRIRSQRWSKFWHPIDEAEHTAVNDTQNKQDDRIEQIREAVKSLPINYQNVIALHYFEELSVEMIAQVIGCRVGTVKSRLSRGREILRSKLISRGEEQNNGRPAFGVLSTKIEV